MKEQLKLLLIHDEAEVNHAYQDSEGYWTIGVGHLIDKRKGGKISHAAIMFILDEDIEDVLFDCRSNFPWFDGLTDDRKVVIASMVFNLGLAGFKGFKKTIALIQAGDYYKASYEMLRSKWADQVGIRAIRLSEMMRNG